MQTGDFFFVLFFVFSRKSGGHLCLCGVSLRACVYVCAHLDACTHFGVLAVVGAAVGTGSRWVRRQPKPSSQLLGARPAESPSLACFYIFIYFILFRQYRESAVAGRVEVIA